eukprot:gene2106-7978_t
MPYLYGGYPYSYGYSYPYSYGAGRTAAARELLGWLLLRTGTGAPPGPATTEAAELPLPDGTVTIIVVFRWPHVHSTSDPGRMRVINDTQR